MTGPSENELKLVVLHQNPQYMEDCMKILNEQWPRSKTLRLRSLNASNDEFPISLVLLRRTSESKVEVIGHSKINILPQDENGAWVESVVIRQDLRGKGYGRVLMTETERYIRTRGYSMVYLSTHDKQGFYGKLGYEFCAPVCVYGGTVHKLFLPKQFITSIVPAKCKPSEINGVQEVNDLCKELSIKGSDVPHTSAPLPPPPPPPPPPASKTKKDLISKLDVTATSKMYMKKKLL